MDAGSGLPARSRFGIGRSGMTSDTPLLCGGVVHYPIVFEIRKFRKVKCTKLNFFKVDDERGVVRRGRGFSPSGPEVYFDMFDFLQ